MPRVSALVRLRLITCAAPMRSARTFRRSRSSIPDRSLPARRALQWKFLIGSTGETHPGPGFLPCGQKPAGLPLHAHGKPRPGKAIARRSSSLQDKPLAVAELKGAGSAHPLTSPPNSGRRPQARQRRQALPRCAKPPYGQRAAPGRRARLCRGTWAGAADEGPAAQRCGIRCDTEVRKNLPVPP